MLHWWLESDPRPMPPQEATRMLLGLSLRGCYWANGFEGAPPDADPV